MAALEVSIAFTRTRLCLCLYVGIENNLGIVRQTFEMRLGRDSDVNRLTTAITYLLIYLHPQLAQY